MRTRIKEVLETQELTQELLTVRGWVRTIRGQGISFIDLSDGSCLKPLQVVVPKGTCGVTDVKTGASISVTGKLVESKGHEQAFEMLAESLEVIGKSDATEYPMQPKRHSMEYMRDHSHMRMRTDLFGSVFRIRDKVAYGIHKFFQEKGYKYVHTPVITASDCEGAGETFGITPKDFFDRDVSLTVSGQLHGETAMMGLGEIYTFGPTFRAEESFTSRHLSEFWMVEPEIAFADLDEIAFLSEEFLKYVIEYTMGECKDEIEYLRDWKREEEKGLKMDLRSEALDEKLQGILDKKFVRITYTEAIEILQRSKPYKKGRFEFPVDWGLDLKAEHEKFLVKKFDSPVIVTDYPKDLKAFYMKVSEDGKTVKAMDVLFPEIGEIIGGSQREEVLDTLIERMRDYSIEPEQMDWYIDTRKFGTIPHAGFGLGFERLVQFITGMSSIKDVCLYHRSAKSCKY
ncbi:MAG: Asparagine--tRNA ligase [uncultured marine phage]|uniref:asparagine--tRNA ligase n=1 Tax=uncultured marine phage TaxID=707152 RepID=A0A8D9FQZ7_9VIRU|nr:MAG: Asparagine--tRNA ligase [uncultured marine phage]